jgi:2-polyprenyl-6-methoxyphenol hydroxylase-like FAD-dependent oxidoreductase
MSDRCDVDFAIVRFGPVGNTLAILLAQSGRSVIALERELTPYPKPRAAHFDDEGSAASSSRVGSATTRRGLRVSPHCGSRPSDDATGFGIHRQLVTGSTDRSGSFVRAGPLTPP